MAEPEKKPETEAPADGAPAAASSAKGKGPMGPVLAAIAVLGIGMGLGFFGYKVIAHPTEKGKKENDKGPTAVRHADEKELRKVCLPVNVGEIMANVRNEAGRHYVKVTVQVWVDKKDAAELSGEEVQPIMRETLEESLHSFTMQELSGEFVHTQLRSTFKERLDNKLRELLGTSGTDRIYIVQVVLNNLLVQ